MIGPQFIAEALLDIISHKVKGIEKRLKKIDRYLDELGNYQQLGTGRKKKKH